MRTNAARSAVLADACSRTAHDEVVRIIEHWDAALAVGRGVLWSPTIRCAVIADMPWLDVRRVTCASAVRHLSGLFVLNRHDLFASRHRKVKGFGSPPRLWMVLTNFIVLPQNGQHSILSGLSCVGIAAL